jgi:hypothetical protein
MKRRNQVLLLTASPCVVVAVAVMAGCFQAYDPTSATGGPLPTGDDGGGSGTVSSASCAPGVVCDNPTTQCTLDSPQCFYLCGSPLCALSGSGSPDAMAPPIPQATGVPPIYLADGSTTADPCVQIEAESLAIRAQSCAPCHSAANGSTHAACACALSNILDDQAVLAGKSPSFTADGGGPASYVVPGDPADSLIYERVAGGSMPPAPSLAANILGAQAAASLIYPTPADLSVLNTWILNCVAGTDGGAYASSAYGGGLGGSSCFGPCGQGGASDAGTGD